MGGMIVGLVLAFVMVWIVWHVMKPRDRTIAETRVTVRGETLPTRLRPDPPSHKKRGGGLPSYRISYPRSATRPVELAFVLVASAAQLLLARFFFTDETWVITAILTGGGTFLIAIALVWSQYRFFHARRDTVVEDGTVRIYQKNKLVQTLEIASISSARLIERTSGGRSSNTVVFLEVDVAGADAAVTTVKFKEPHVEPEELYEALDKHIKAANS